MLGGQKWLDRLDAEDLWEAAGRRAGACDEDSTWSSEQLRLCSAAEEMGVAGGAEPAHHRTVSSGG